MSAFFRDAHLKLDWANEHIRYLDTAISAVEEDAIATLQKDGGSSTEFVKHEHPKLNEGLLRLSLMAGDAIHNLRVTLDYAWSGILHRHAPWAVSDHNSFPVRETREKVENALHGIEVDTRCHALFDTIVSDIQPYDGGNGRLIWELHKIDISNKHILLLELLPKTGIVGIALEDESGQIYEGISITTEPNKPHIIRTKPGLKIKNKGKFSLNVTIKEAGAFKGFLILDLLTAFSDSVLNVLNRLEKL
jgi:hypothetical protein